MNLSEALLHALKEHGAREIFGIPGDYALPFFKVVDAHRPAAVDPGAQPAGDHRPPHVSGNPARRAGRGDACAQL